MQQGSRWQIRSAEKIAEISAEALGGWKAEVSLHQSAVIAYSELLAWVGITTSRAELAATNALVKLEFPDGGTVAMGPYSSVKADFMKDGQYALVGSGAVFGVTAEGGNYVLGGRTPIMLGGGPRIEAWAPWDFREPSSYSTQVALQGSGPGQAIVEVNGEKISLAPNSTRRVVLPNGTRFELSLSSRDGGIRAAVSKGLVHFRPDSVKQVGLPLLTGQSVTLGWHAGGRLFEVERHGGEGSVFVSMPDRSVGILGPLGKLSVIREDAITYSVAAPNGQVSIYDAASDQVTGVTPQKLIRPVDGPQLGLISKVHFAGVNESEFRVHINGRGPYTFKDAEKSEGVLTLDGLELRPSESGSKWQLRSKDRPALVTGEALGDWTAEVALGEAATFSYSQSKAFVEIFTATGSNKESKALVVMTLAQESKAVIGPYSSAKADILKDGSFILTGGGRVEGRLAGRGAFTLAGLHLPLIGGPPLKSADPAQKNSGSPKSPVTAVKIRGVSPGAALIDVGDQEIKLTNSSRAVLLPNGSEILFSFPKEVRGLRCFARKGYFAIEHSGFGTGQAVLLSDQLVDLEWNQEQKTHEIRQAGGASSAKFVFPDDSVATLRTGSAIRVRREAEDKVVAESFLGPVALWESASHATKMMAEKRVFGIEAPGLGEVTRIRFIGTGANDFGIRVNGRRVFGFEDIVNSRGRLIVEGLAIESTQNGRRWTIHSIAKEAEITAETVVGWSARVTLGQSAMFDYAAPKAAVGIRTMPGPRLTNKKVVILQLPDGAVASLGFESVAKVDRFPDGSYTLSGFGVITGTSADGKSFALDGSSAPLTGGPLKKIEGPDGKERIIRSTPVVSAVVRGALGEDLQVFLEEQQATVGTAGVRRIATRRGSEIEFSQDVANGALRISVVKGHVILDWDRMRGAKVILLSDQEARIGLGDSKQTVEIEHVAGGNDRLVLILPNQSVANLALGSALQLAPESKDSFWVQAPRGEVSVWDVSSGQLLRLGLQKRLFAVASQVETATTRVHLIGSRGEVFLARVNEQRQIGIENAVQAGGKIVVDGVEFQPSDNGAKWMIRSVERVAEITTDALGDWKASVPIGASVSIHYSKPRLVVGMATSQAGLSDSGDLIRLRMPDGATAAMGRSSRVLTEVYKDGSYTLVGTGEVGGVTADGVHFAFNGGQLPLGGGALRKILDSNGKEAVRRASPILEARVRGNLGSDIHVRLGDQEIVVGGIGIQRVTTPNGFELEFSQDLLNRYLRVAVGKGHVVFNVEGTASASPVALSGQVIGLGWNSDQRQLDVSQLSEGWSIPIGLQSRSVLHLNRESAVRITRDSGSSFSAQTLKGRVSFWESVTSPLALTRMDPPVLTRSDPAR